METEEQGSAGADSWRVEPEDFLGYRLVRIAQALEARFKRGLSGFGLSPRQFSVLAVLLERPEVTVAELARAVLTTPQSMAALIEGLEARELITRSRPRRRGVAAPLTLTVAGRELVARAGPSVLRMEDAVFAGLTGPQVLQLRGLLGRLEDRLEL